MKKKYLIILLLGLLLINGCSEQPAISGEEELKQETEKVDEKYATYEDIGRVISATKTEKGVDIIAEGYYGYHMDENPSMTLRIIITTDGIIEQISFVESYNQTAGFDGMINQEYLDMVYKENPAIPIMNVDMVTGATATSTAALYSVQTAAYYAQNVYGYKADLDREEKEALNVVLPADYETIQTQYSLDKSIGNVIYAAQDEQYFGIKVQGSKEVNWDGGIPSSYDSAIPSPYTLIIIIDKATNKVLEYEIIVDGTKTDVFRVPEEKLEAYKNVEISSANVFDDYSIGLVTDYDKEWDYEQDGDSKILTGTSVVYTGATINGTLSSQMIRNCFKAAAYYYTNY